MILPDTSAWIEFQRATESPVHQRLRAAFETEERLACTGLVMLELLAGARDERQGRDLRRMLGRCTFVPLEEPFDNEVAAGIYRACRRGGSTVRRTADCLIAAVAIRVEVPVLQRDSDFDAIALHSPLALVRV